MLELTGSAVALGIATALQFRPAAALRALGRRRSSTGSTAARLIMCTQTARPVLAAVLAVLTLTGTVELWMVYALALALGHRHRLRHPRPAGVRRRDGRAGGLRQRPGAELHDPQRRAAGRPGDRRPADRDDGVGVGVRRQRAVLRRRADRPAPHRPGPPAGRSPSPERQGQAARAGLRYVLAPPELRARCCWSRSIALFGQNFRVVLPLLAQDDVLGGGAETYGYLTAALGARRGHRRAGQRRPARRSTGLGAAAVRRGLRRGQPGRRRPRRADRRPRGMVAIGIANIIVQHPRADAAAARQRPEHARAG